MAAEDTELFVAGIGIARAVVASIAAAAAERVEGVARVGGNDSRWFGPVNKREILGTVITVVRRNNL